MADVQIEKRQWKHITNSLAQSWFLYTISQEQREITTAGNCATLKSIDGAPHPLRSLTKNICTGDCPMRIQ